jgi:hypothetical protein
VHLQCRLAGFCAATPGRLVLAQVCTKVVQTVSRPQSRKLCTAYSTSLHQPSGSRKSCAHQCA